MAESDNAQQRKEDNLNEDLHDSAKDIAAMKENDVTLKLPEVSDIPGQENIQPAPMGELSDTTIASDDEEGVGLFDDEDAEEGFEEGISGYNPNVTKEEKRDLENADQVMPSADEQNLQDAALDNEDEDGEELNEGSFGEDVSGSDLDVPGTGDDDEMEDIGEEDEENNDYSIDKQEDDSDVVI